MTYSLTIKHCKENVIKFALNSVFDTLMFCYVENVFSIFRTYGQSPLVFTDNTVPIIDLCQLIVHVMALNCELLRYISWITVLRTIKRPEFARFENI